MVNWRHAAHFFLEVHIPPVKETHARHDGLAGESRLPVGAVIWGSLHQKQAQGHDPHASDQTENTVVSLAVGPTGRQ